METSSQSLIARRYPALASRDYVLFIIGQLISVIGTWMQSTALPYLAYRMTGRPLDLGIIGFSSTLPTLLFALPAGVLVERWDKRKVVISGVAVEVTARQAMLIELTGREALPSAIALQTTAFNVGRVIGPLCAAWIISATGGEGAVFLVNAISFIFVIAGLFLAQTRFKVEQQTTTERNLRGEFKEGLRYIRSNTVVLSVILMAALVGFFGIPLIQQVPALARDVLKTLADTEAIIATRTSNLYAAQGVGALIAAFLAATMISTNKHRMLMLGQISFIIPMIALGFATRINTALILLACIGWGTVTQLVMMNTLVQTEVPDNLRGRVFSVYFWALQGVAPFGSIVIGWIAQTWKVPVAAIIAGTICLLGIALIRLTLRERVNHRLNVS